MTLGLVMLEDGFLMFLDDLQVIDEGVDFVNRLFVLFVDLLWIRSLFGVLILGCGHEVFPFGKNAASAGQAYFAEQS
jgi:hypothetical protein